MDPHRHAARRRRATVLGPLALALVQTVGTFGAARAQPDRRAPDLLAVLVAVAGPAALTLVRRHPVPVLAWVAALTSLYLLRDYPYGPVLASMVVAVVVTVVRGHRVAAWVATAAVVAVPLVARSTAPDHPWSWTAFTAVGAWVLLVLAAAELARTRVARTADLRRARAEARRREQNEERLRIAREIHDVVAHHMSLVNVQASTALHLLDKRAAGAQARNGAPEPTGLDGTRTALEAIKGASKEALSELRSLVDVLRDTAEPAPRSPVDRLASLPTLVARARSAGIATTLEVTGEQRSLPTQVDHAAFRIVQEAVTNVVRHAAAQRAAITLRYEADRLVVVVQDDGRGPAGLRAGNGIRGMTERAAACGGTLELTPAAGGGTRIDAVLPTAGELRAARAVGEGENT